MKNATKKPSKELGTVIDKLYAFDQDIDVVERQLKKLKDKRAIMERKLLGQLQDGKLEKAAGHKAIASITKREIPTIKNPRKFQKFVIKNNAFDLYQNRVASRAYFARREDGTVVPGVEVFKKVSVSIRKRG